MAGGCLWGVEEFFRHIDGIEETEAGRANGSSNSLEGPYDGYVECVKIIFNQKILNIRKLVFHLFEIIDPYSLNVQGPHKGKKYRSGIYSRSNLHLEEVKTILMERKDYSKLRIEILPLVNYIKSKEMHQKRLLKYPNESCHIAPNILYKYAKNRL